MHSVIAKNLRLHMQRQQLNPRELARRANVKSSFIYDVLGGRSRNPSTLHLARLAGSLNIPLSMLVNDEAVTAASGLQIVHHASFDGWLHPPVMKGAIGKTSPYQFSQRWLSQKPNLNADELVFALVPDDTMEPTLKMSDAVLIDRSQTTIQVAGLYWISEGSMQGIRRIESITTASSQLLRIIADNPCYATYEKHAADVSVTGRVVWVGRCFC